jgi:hypothetical protein
MGMPPPGDKVSAKHKKERLSLISSVLLLAAKRSAASMVLQQAAGASMISLPSEAAALVGAGRYTAAPHTLAVATVATAA